MTGGITLILKGTKDGIAEIFRHKNRVSSETALASSLFYIKGGAEMYERQVQRGDIYYADLGKTIGSVQGKIRPVVVLQNNKGNKHSPTLIVATLTSKVRKKRTLPTHVVFQADGLPKESIAQLEQITTIDKKQLLNFVCQMPESAMVRIENAVRISLSLN